MKGSSEVASGEEFNTNVPDKDERKRLRKKRIEKKHSTEAKSNEEATERTVDSHKTGGQQVGDSLFHLDRRKHTSLHDVTEIRVISDDNELKRRGKDEELRRERLSKLQREAIHSAKANAAIEMRWAELLERDIPQELHKEIQTQMVTCRASIKSKDDIIKEFQKQLRGKDEEYVITLRKQSEDIAELLTRIRREFSEMQGEYGREIEAIEEAYISERQTIVGDYGTEIDGMFDHRKNREVQYKEAKQKREDQYQREIEELITKGADQYNKLKIDLEKNIQTLKEQLEEIRATYQLNTEKLDYNYRVLTELDVEKNAELARYKRRLAKLKDQMNQLVTRYSDMEGADTKMNNDLTDDYRSLTQKYKELQAKFRHFEVADSNKYDDVWAMHEDEVKSLVDQLLKADKIIAEQQLGWQWKGPDMNALQMVLGRHGNNPTSQTSASAASNTHNAAQQGDVSMDSMDSAGVVNVHMSARSANSAATSRIRGMLQLLASEAGFLVNADVQQSLESMTVSVEDANLTRAESMLKALGVKNQQRLDSLLSFFFKDTAVAQPVNGFPAKAKLAGDTSAIEEEMDEEELLLHYASGDISELKKMIRPEQVIAAVKSYIEDVSLEGAFGAAPGVRGKKVDEEQRIGQKRLNSMRSYWHQLCQVVSEDSVEVWRQLERDSVGLKELLVKRAAGIAEVDSLARKNVELKRLLNQYLGDANVNNYMMVPPAHVMKVRDVAVPSSIGGTFLLNSSSGTFGRKVLRGERMSRSQSQGGKSRNSRSSGLATLKKPVGMGASMMGIGGARSGEAQCGTSR